MSSKLHVRTSFDYIKRAPFQALSAVSVLAITFFVATLVILLAYSSQQVIRDFETRPQVIAYMNSDALEDSIKALQDKLSSDHRVKDLNYVSQEEALEIYKGLTSDNPLLGELVSPSYLPASLEFSITDLEHVESLIKDLQEEPVVESVDFTASLGGESALGDVVNRLKTVALYIRIGGLVAISVLGVASLLVLTVVIGMKISLRRQEIESLSLIGATSWFIRAPILLEAMLYSITGVFFGWLFAMATVMYMGPNIINYFKPIEILPKDSGAFFILFGIILAGELLIGTLIAFLGSFVAIGRSLRKKVK